MARCSLLAVGDLHLSYMYRSDGVKGDDEYPLLWEGKSGQFLQRDQFFAAQRLGQITAISWMYPPVQSSDSSWTLCVGTGKGYVTVYTVSHLASKVTV